MIEISQTVEFIIAITLISIVCLTIAKGTITGDQLNERIYYPYKNQVCDQILRTAMYEGLINQLAIYYKNKNLTGLKDTAKKIQELTPPTHESVVLVTRDPFAKEIIFSTDNRANLKDFRSYSTYESILGEKIYITVGLL